MTAPATLLGGMLEAIAESDSLLGGVLATRLRHAVPWGGDNGVLAAANPARLTSPVVRFAAHHVGLCIDILPAASPTGNQGSYRIGSIVAGGYAVELVHVATGAAPSFVNEADVRWRLASLPVEGTLGLAARDPALRVLLGTAPVLLPYARLVTTAGAQAIEGLGAWRGDDEGAISGGAPTQLVAHYGAFVAADVGQTVYVLPALGGPNGNEGPHRIATVVDARTVTVSPAFVATESDVAWRLRTGVDQGYPGQDWPSWTVVTDGGRGYSAIDRLRRARMVAFASGEELDAVGRLFGIDRLRGIREPTYRRIVATMAYMPRQTVQAIERVLAVLYPAGGYEIIEDRIARPCTVTVGLPALGASSDRRGRAHMLRDDSVTSTDATHVTLGATPDVVTSILAAPVTQTLDMTVLPSAAGPAWTYVADAAGAEGAYFAIVAERLVQTIATADSGRYQRTITALAGGDYSLRATLAATVVTTVVGYPWQLAVQDGERECALWLSDTAAMLGKLDGTVIAGPVTLPRPITSELDVALVRDGDTLRGMIDGAVLLSAPAASFGASASQTASFGYRRLGGAAQVWTVQWDQVALNITPTRDYAQLRRDDGVLVNPATITSAAALFVLADTGKLVRTVSATAASDGLWRATYVDPSTLTLGAVVRAAEASVAGSVVTLDVPRFDRLTTGKVIVISGSTDGNDGSYTVLAWGGDPGLTGADATLTELQARVDTSGLPGGVFNTETGLDWGFAPNVTAGACRWELIDALTNVGPIVTLRETLPAATLALAVRYSTDPSAQVLADESVVNEGTGPPDQRWPVYLLDVDEATRALLDQITAAGVIVDFTVPSI